MRENVAKLIPLGGERRVALTPSWLNSILITALGGLVLILWNGTTAKVDENIRHTAELERAIAPASTRRDIEQLQLTVNTILAEQTKRGPSIGASEQRILSLEESSRNVTTKIDQMNDRLMRLQQDIDFLVARSERKRPSGG